MKRNILITGGGKGLGKHIVKAFAGENASIYISGRDKAALLAVQSEYPCVAGIYQADFSDTGSTESFITAALKDCGGFDLAVLNAATYLEKPVELTTPEEWHNIININLTSNFIIVKRLIESVKGRNGGRIIAISSVGGRMGLAGKSAYCASKFGFTGFMKAVAKEAAKYKIAVNIVYPYYIDSHLQANWADENKPLDMCHPDDAAALIKFLADMPINMNIEDIYLDTFTKK